MNPNCCILQEKDAKIIELMEENKSQANIIDDLEFIIQSLEDKIRDMGHKQIVIINQVLCMRYQYQFFNQIFENDIYVSSLYVLFFVNFVVNLYNHCCLIKLKRCFL